MLFKSRSFARLTSKNWLIIIALGKYMLDVETRKEVLKVEGNAISDTSTIAIDNLHAYYTQQAV